MFIFNTFGVVIGISKNSPALRTGLFIFYPYGIFTANQLKSEITNHIWCKWLFIFYL